MRLSTVFELLLIFLFLAFAASRTIHEKKGSKGKQQVAAAAAATPTTTQNRYCQCSQLMCNCCRDFSLPVVSLKGPGCASVAYMNEDAVRLTMTFGDKVLRNITLAGKRPNPVCMPLPGGVSKFCGRVYGISREGDHFKACLALELRSLEDLEAALRVSCFKFGPEGVKLEPGKPVPVAPVDEDEDDDDDDYGFADDDDDDDDDDVLGLGGDDDDDDEDNDVDAGDTDYTGFSALSDEFLEGFFLGEGGSSGSKKPTKTTTTAKPLSVKATKKPSKKVTSTTAKVNPTVVTATPAQHTTKMISTTATQQTTTYKPVGSTGTKSEEVTTTTNTYTQESPVNEVQASEPQINEIQASVAQVSQVLANEPQINEIQATIPQVNEVHFSDAQVNEVQANKAQVIEVQMNEAQTNKAQANEGTVTTIAEVPTTDDPVTKEEEIEEDEEDGDEEEEEEGNESEATISIIKKGEDDEGEEDQNKESNNVLGSRSERLSDSVGGGSGRGGNITPEETERLFPGLSALIRPPSYLSHSFPPVRSARTHRRMRLPPTPTEFLYTI